MNPGSRLSTDTPCPVTLTRMRIQRVEGSQPEVAQVKGALGTVWAHKAAITPISLRPPSETRPFKVFDHCQCLVQSDECVMCLFYTTR